MKRYIKAASSISALQDAVMFVYDYAMQYCDTQLVEEILIDNGAQESDEGPDGFLTGVNKQQLINIIAELTHLLSNVVNKSESSLIVDIVDSQLDDWIDSGMSDVDIDDAIFDLGGDESTIDELRRRGRIDENGHYVYKL